MTPTVTFFPVGNGDMTLIQMETGRTILIDINIRQPDEDGEIRDVLADLRARLPKDKLGRHYVDAMLLTHPDQDHCRGLVEHFHLGPLTDYVEPDEGEDGKIVIREIWSSPMVFRRRPAGDPLCDDADAWAKEARRRANLHKAGGGTVLTGDRIQVMGEDLPEKMEGIEDIVVKAGTNITTIDGYHDESFSGFLLAPKGKGNAADEERRSKNHSSVIVRFSLARDERLDATRYLAGGDALVGIWERIWADYRSRKDVLEYHLLGAPHHCSWGSLSAESWSESGGTASVSSHARKALGQALDGAYIVSSSKPVVDDDDPPCIGAKREYEDIVDGVGGTFVNTAEHKSDAEAEPMVFEVTASGAVLHEAGTALGKRVDANVAKGLTAAALVRRAEQANDRAETSKPQTPSKFA